LKSSEINVPVIIDSADEQRILVGQKIASSLNLPITTELSNSINLVIKNSHIELDAPEFGKPITIDFISGKNAHRRKFGGGRGQPLAKALGLKAGRSPSVIDATAGYGRDAFVIASLGCRVTLIERQGLLWALLSDAIQLAQHDQTITDVAERMRVVHASSIDYLTGLEMLDWPEVVYMDPMYPSREKSALVKKDMQLLHKLVGPDTDSEHLLSIAKQRAKKRVVVKRPKSADFIAQQRPSVSIESKNTRYDVYVCA
jgi:16S rRNA (guanine1516-N2)-methyltransferase